MVNNVHVRAICEHACDDVTAKQSTFDLITCFDASWTCFLKRTPD